MGKPSIVGLQDNAAASTRAFIFMAFLAALANDARHTARKTCHNAANFFSTIAANHSAATRFDWPTPVHITHLSEGTPLNLPMASAAMLSDLTGSVFAFKCCKLQSSRF